MLRRLSRLFNGSRIEALEARIQELEATLASTRDRVTSYYRLRFDTLDCIADYLVGAELTGDYAEFGVFKGATFQYAARCMQSVAALRPMRFLAFDSFQGLPAPTGIDAAGGFTSSFEEGAFANSRERFVSDVAGAGVDMSRVVTVEGWFNETLTDATAEQHDIDAIAVAWVDCDLYESTIPVLDFLAPRVVSGSVIAFDDWRCFRNLPGYGQQRACREWLERNPNLALHPFISFGFHGMSFTVERP